MGDTPRLYRIIAQVSDLAKGANFYARLLGTEGRQVSPGRHYFDCGEVIFAIFDPAREGGGAARPNPDYSYFGVADLEAVHERARELDCLSGGTVHGHPAGEIVTQPWGERSFYASDPFGNPLCFVDETTIFTGR